MIKPPKGFTALQWAIGISDRPYDTMGVCVDYFEPAKSKGTDYTSQFILHDQSWIQDRGMKFRFFNGSIDKLPKIQTNGDVVILRNVRTRTHNNQSIGISNSTTSWVVLSGSSILESTCDDGSDITFVTSSTGFDRAPAPTIEELKYAKEMVHLEDPTAYRPPPKSTALDIETRMTAAGGTPLPRKEKWRLIQDLVPQTPEGRNTFADLFGEVRKSWYNDFGRVELSITDYTNNKLLYNYTNETKSRDGDKFSYTDSLHNRWQGPWGRMTISVLLYDTHAAFAKSQVKPGMYVLVKNCHIKVDPKQSKLEAVCRGDREDLSKVNVLIFNPRQADTDQRFRDLLKRRLEYEKLAKTKGLRFGLGKETHPDIVQRSIEITETGYMNPDTKAQSPKRKSKSQKRKNQATKQKANPVTELTAPPNQYVRCNNINVPLTSIDNILDPITLKRQTPDGHNFSLPFQNCSYKCKVRVVNYYPHELTEFSVPYLVSDYDALSDIGTADNTELALTAAQSNPHTVRWEWRFFLIIEDASARVPSPDFPRQQMALLVADEDAEFLLNEEASDLKADPRVLANLREKLFVLWGDLQERKEEAVSIGKASGVKAQSKPFECFVKEYGVPVLSEHDRDANASDTYQRMFRLFGTSI